MEMEVQVKKREEKKERRKVPIPPNSKLTYRQIDVTCFSYEK